MPLRPGSDLLYDRSIPTIGISWMTPGHAEARALGSRTEDSLVRRYHATQRLVVDYSIGVAILGFFHNFLTTVLVLAFFLQLKMLWDIARFWNFRFSYNPITIIGELLNFLGAIAIGLIAWTSFVFLGAFIPLVDHYALSAGLMSGFWTLGAAANQFFLNGFFHRYLRHRRRIGHG